MAVQSIHILEIRQQLKKELGIANELAVPKLTKIVVNIGLGEALTDSKVLERAAEQMAVITGQKPRVTRAKVSISSFKLRAGDEVGLKVTLRGVRMYDFLTKLIRVVLPRMRDFRGLSKAGFDGQGNYNVGLAEQIVFPEIDYAKIDKVRGLQITLVTTAKDDETSFKLLKILGVPLEKERNETERKNLIQ